MPSTVLIANTGRETGSPSSRRLRTEEKIPGVLYGHGMSPLCVTVDRRELRHAVSGGAGTTPRHPTTAATGGAATASRPSHHGGRPSEGPDTRGLRRC